MKSRFLQLVDTAQLQELRGVPLDDPDGLPQPAAQDEFPPTGRCVPAHILAASKHDQGVRRPPGSIRIRFDIKEAALITFFSRSGQLRENSNGNLDFRSAFSVPEFVPLIEKFLSKRKVESWRLLLRGLTSPRKVQIDEFLLRRPNPRDW